MYEKEREENINNIRNNIYYISNNEIKATPLKKDLYYQEVGNRTVFYIQEGRKYHKVQKNPLYGKVGYAEGQFEFRYYVFEQCYYFNF